MRMKLALIGALTLAGCATVVPTAPPPPVATAPELRTLAAEIAARPDLSMFDAQIAASGDAHLTAAAPVTVFATRNEAFGRLAPDVAASLLAPENRPMLSRIVAYRLVPGAIDEAELRRRVAAGNGRTTLVTLAGDPLVVTLTGGTLTLTDADGDRAYVDAGIRRANGILYPVNGFLAPAIE